eukprot:gb/GEZJ01011832.1/.p1 GENE.gb/GEZJ01011832.1/~~gb/GEZJ01011832.1/.p1  ORF type:complete len:106 (+),score=17.96 gb/GEZJ01011832.1/:175-492(+)
MQEKHKKAHAEETECVATLLVYVVKREMLTAEKEHQLETANHKNENELRQCETAPELLADAVKKQWKDVEEHIQASTYSFRSIAVSHGYFWSVYVVEYPFPRTNH